MNVGTTKRCQFCDSTHAVGWRWTGPHGPNNISEGPRNTCDACWVQLHAALLGRAHWRTLSPRLAAELEAIKRARKESK